MSANQLKSGRMKPGSRFSGWNVKTGVCVGGVGLGGPNHHNGFCRIVLPPGRANVLLAFGATGVTQAGEPIGTQVGSTGSMRSAPPPADPPTEPGELARGRGAAGPA